MIPVPGTMETAYPFGHCSKGFLQMWKRDTDQDGAAPETDDQKSTVFMAHSDTRNYGYKSESLCLSLLYCFTLELNI